MADLTVGKKAPLFTLPSDGGQDISLSDYKGGKVILYFYPKDNTSGCTLEAQAFRANLEEFKKRGYSILGVSRDSVKKHCNFRDKYELNFPLCFFVLSPILTAESKIFFLIRLYPPGVYLSIKKLNIRNKSEKPVRLMLCCPSAGEEILLRLFLRFTSCLPHTIMKENIFL